MGGRQRLSSDVGHGSFGTSVPYEGRIVKRVRAWGVSNASLDRVQVEIKDMRGVIRGKQSEVVLHNVQQELGKQRHGLERVFGCRQVVGSL